MLLHFSSSAPSSVESIRRRCAEYDGRGPSARETARRAQSMALRELRVLVTVTVAVSER